MRITIDLDGEWRPAVEIATSSPAEPVLEGGAAPASLARDATLSAPDAPHEEAGPTETGHAPESEEPGVG